MDRIVLSLLVDNTSGVLSRVAGLFSRRGYNIESLTVGVTADERYSRIREQSARSAAFAKSAVTAIDCGIYGHKFFELAPAAVYVHSAFSNHTAGKFQAGTAFEQRDIRKLFAAKK